MVKKRPAKQIVKAKAQSAGKKDQAKPTSVSKKSATVGKAKAAVKLLAGGNPQIPLGYGEAPIKAYIAAMPGWKCQMGRKIDALIVKAVPNVYKAVKWNSPFYGYEDDGWFLSFHCYTKYIQIAFFQGTMLQPVPSGMSKHKTVRYLNVFEDEFDETQFVAWVKQASKLPTEKM